MKSLHILILAIAFAVNAANGMDLKTMDKNHVYGIESVFVNAEQLLEMIRQRNSLFWELNFPESKSTQKQMIVRGEFESASDFSARKRKIEDEENHKKRSIPERQKILQNLNSKIDAITSEPYTIDKIYIKKYLPFFSLPRFNPDKMEFPAIKIDLASEKKPFLDGAGSVSLLIDNLFLNLSFDSLSEAQEFKSKMSGSNNKSVYSVLTAKVVLTDIVLPKLVSPERIERQVVNKHESVIVTGGGTGYLPNLWYKEKYGDVKIPAKYDERTFLKFTAIIDSISFYVDDEYIGTILIH